MAVTAVPAFGQATNLGTAILTAAKTDPFSGASNAVLLFTAGSNGSIVTGVGAIPRDTINTASVIMVYESTDGGTTLNLIDAQTLATYSYAAGTALPKANFNNTNGQLISPTNPLYVPASKTLYASGTIALANGIAVNAIGVDL